MATDWTAIEQSAIQAAEGVLKKVWPTVARGAIAATSSLVGAAKYIEDNIDHLTADEGKLLMAQQKAAMQNVLSGYESIGIAIAISAADAVITAIIKAVPVLIGFV